MSKGYDRRDIATLLTDLNQTLAAPQTEATVHQALLLQRTLIAFLYGQIGTLQIQLELLTKPQPLNAETLMPGPE